MIYIPTGKAIVAVEVKDDDRYCERDCALYCDDPNCQIACRPDERKDGKSVIFKLVDYKEVTSENH